MKQSDCHSAHRKCPTNHTIPCRGSLHRAVHSLVEGKQQQARIEQLLCKHLLLQLQPSTAVCANLP